MVFASLGVSDTGRSSLIKDYQRWVTLHFLFDEEAQKEEDNMREEFDSIMSLAPKITVHKDGSLAVSGLNDKPKRTTPKASSRRRRQG